MLGAEKTRLQVFHPNTKDQNDLLVEDAENPIVIDGKVIPFSDSAEHVGVTRSICGNGPAIFARFSAHQKALGALLHQGIAKGHRANPCFSLKVVQLYATPVLFSGLGALILSSKEAESVETHYRETLRQILRLQKGTPRCVIYFMAGSLPGIALLHLRQLSILGMISRLPDNILNKHAMNIFSFSTIAKKSWFHQIRHVCLIYDLPHPSILLQRPLTKFSFKKLTKSRVVSYWEYKLRNEASGLKSTSFFNCNFMSLTKVHPLFTTAGHSSVNVARSLVQSVMLSGRYRCGALLRHWKKDYDGCCLISAQCQGQLEDITHILQLCRATSDTRESLTIFTRAYSLNLPDILRDLLVDLCHPNSKFYCQFLLDCSSIPAVISASQILGESFVLDQLFYISRIWVYAIHRERLKKLGTWKRQNF